MSYLLARADARRLPLPDASVDAIVTDPPYDLTSGKKGGAGEASLNENSAAGRARISTGGGFMGKTWDATGVAFDPETWREALRVLKPGAHLVAFGAPRTYHRLACAIEDAGFEFRDSPVLFWLFGSGFPKSLDVSKAIDRAAGAEREVVGDKLDRPGYHLHGHDGGGAFGHGLSSSTPETRAAAAKITVPATEEARRWEGWGTALKPAYEPIVLARKPLVGTVAQNVLAHGTGALNIDGTRVVGVRPDEAIRRLTEQGPEIGMFSPGTRPVGENAGPNMAGRWPANVLLDEASAELLDESVGTLTSGRMRAGQRRRASQGLGGYGDGFPDEATRVDTPGDSGGPSRFFYTSKASRTEREAGLDDLEPVRRSDGRDSDIENPRLRTNARRNDHPTVKPVDLMRWLVTLVTPPNGTVLDPFMGSGSTGVAAVELNFHFLGYDLEPRYVEIAHRRLVVERPMRFAL